MQGRKNQGSRGLSPQFWHEKKQNPFLQKAFGYYIPPLIFLPFYGPAMALVEYIALSWRTLFIAIAKTFIENWDSKRHLLELSWPI